VEIPVAMATAMTKAMVMSSAAASTMAAVATVMAGATDNNQLNKAALWLWLQWR
jgi:hypothetical protein